MIAITMNRLKHSNEKKWDYTYSYYWKDIDGTDNFVAVDYCNEMSKKELNYFCKEKNLLDFLSHSVHSASQNF